MLRGTNHINLVRVFFITKSATKNYVFLNSGVDVYAAISGAVGALYGPLHGGATDAVSKMLSEIGTVENIPDFIQCVKNK